MIRKIGVVIGFVIVIATVGLGIFVYNIAGMAQRIGNEEVNVTKVDLKKIADGEYLGSYGDFVVNTSVKVTVKNHRIDKIIITKQDCGPGYDAKDTVGRIIKAQSPKVDVVTGASSSSRTIMIAVYRALKQAVK